MNPLFREFKNRMLPAALILTFLMSFSGSLHAGGQSSDNFAVPRDDFSGGSGEVSSGNFIVNASTGQSSPIGISSCPSHIVFGGYWGAMAPVIPPTPEPTETPTITPTSEPTDIATEAPTGLPTQPPTETPAAATQTPTITPTVAPVPAIGVPETIFLLLILGISMTVSAGTRRKERIE